jgi:hypothetical protein
LRGGGIDLRNIIVVLASFSGFFLAYFGLSGLRAFVRARLEAKTCIGVSDLGELLRVLAHLQLA